MKLVITTAVVVLGLLSVLQYCHAVTKTYVSAQSVTNPSVLTDQTLNPKLVNCGGLTCSLYIQPASCLGSFGPISAYGPLGALGPVENNTPLASITSAFFNSWMSALGLNKHDTLTKSPSAKDSYNWGTEFTGITERAKCKTCPMSKYGPLGSGGPLGTAYSQMKNINDFAAHLDAQGLFTVLGPLGPLGALGSLGPLGPLGAHGFNQKETGEYVDAAGKVQRTVTVNYQGSTTRRYELFEYYKGDFATNMKDNDCSWLAKKTFSSKGETHSFNFASSQDQYVTIAVIPYYQLDTFHLTIHDKTTNAALAFSRSNDFINWVQLKVSAGQKLVAKVTFVSTAHFASHTYFIHVVGSTNNFSSTTITGRHILNQGQ